MTDKFFDLVFCGCSLVGGGLMLFFGIESIAALCVFMAGAFFERAYPGGVLRSRP